MRKPDELSTTIAPAAANAGAHAFDVVAPAENSARSNPPIVASDSGWMIGLLPGNQYVWQSRAAHEFVILDEMAAVVRRIAWPDSLGSSGATMTADRTGLVILAARVVKGAFRQDAYRLSLGDGSILHLDSLPTSASWGCSGIREAFGFTRMDSLTGIHTIRVPLTGGRFVDEGPLPVQGEIAPSFSCSQNSLRGTETVYRISRDIVLFKHFDSNEP